MDGLSKRIVGLSPEKRKLLETLLAERDAQKPDHLSSREEPIQAKPSPHVGTKANAGDSDALYLLSDDSLTSDETKRYSRRVYNEISRQLDSSQLGKHAVFCTLGYLPDGSPEYSQVKLPQNILNKNMVKLALELIGDCDLAQCRVLDVGCGRGGTISVIADYFVPRAAVGMDLSSGAIASCKRNHVYPQVFFLEGDAEQLPFKDEAFDVVTNVESSHSYPNLHSFYGQVHRVLKKGGYFLYTDVLPTYRWEESERTLEQMGFRCEKKRDITRNVLLSCDETARTKLQAYEVHNDRHFMGNFLGTPDSELYWLMKNGEWPYLLFKFRKN